MERELWFFNKWMWAFFTVLMFVEVLALDYMGASLTIDTLTSLEVGLGFGVLGVIGALAHKFPPKSVQM